MTTSLQTGQYFGKIIREKRFGPFILVEKCHHGPGVIEQHSHNNAYLSLVLAGTWKEALPERQRHCKPETLLYHPPEELHIDQFGGGEVRLFNIEFQSEWFEKIAATRNQFKLSLDLTSENHQPFSVQIYREFLQQDELSRLAIEGALLQLLTSVARHTDSSDAPIPGWLKEAKYFIDLHLSGNLVIEKIAANFGIHPGHFSRTFKEYYHFRPMQYIRQSRILHAQNLLKTKHLSLSSIALECGFADQSHFTRTFHSATGTTPGKWRRWQQSSKDSK